MALCWKGMMLFFSFTSGFLSTKLEILRYLKQRAGFFPQTMVYRIPYVSQASTFWKLMDLFDGKLIGINWWNSIPSYLPPKKKIINFQGMVSWVSLKNLRDSLRFPKLRGLICFTRRLWTHTRRAGCNCHLAQWYYRGTFCGQLLSWWFRNSANKLRLVVYPIIYDGFY